MGIHALKSAAPVFVYHFGYRGKHSLAHIKPNTYPPELHTPSHHYGVGNGDDLMYLFPVHWGIFRPFPSDDIMFSTKFSSLLATFARTGKPEFSMGEGETPFEWKRVDPNNIFSSQYWQSHQNGPRSSQSQEDVILAKHAC